MEYSAGNVSNLLWFVEMRETAKLLQNQDVKEVQRMVLEENIYQQKAENRARREFNCIKRRLDAIPDALVKLMIDSDINTANRGVANEVRYYVFDYEPCDGKHSCLVSRMMMSYS